MTGKSPGSSDLKPFECGTTRRQELATGVGLVRELVELVETKKVGEDEQINSTLFVLQSPRVLET